MARRKKRKDRPHSQTAYQRGEDAFNPGFKGLGALKQKSEDIPQEPKKEGPPEPCPGSEGDDYFTEAMSGVTP
ncbi:MAG: hypothetical protein H8E19_12925, partial [Deltaproteobacteria bacterium]|nr:hypothetical protein [Candidatus Desulfacyla euxinica]